MLNLVKSKSLIAGIATVFAFSHINAQAPVVPSNQTQLIEKVTALPGEIKIAYEKYRLPNGLTLFIHEDHSDPIVHVEVTYHTGSARETPGKSGFAHFFEHMMFQGSEHVRDEEHFKLIQGAGGNMNGTTDRDRTNYFETLPSNYLETALWLESDRMGFLLDSVTQKKFEVQRSTVKNEKGQNVDNVPYGKKDEMQDFILYPTGHPYSWSTIGYVEDLDRVNVEDLKNFFMRWYGPNNASLVVAGDVNPAEVLKLTEKYFGAIPRGPEVRKQRVEPFRLPDIRRASIPDSKITMPLLNYTWPTPPAYHADDAALDVMSNILSDGKNSLLYKNFDKSEKSNGAGSFNSSSELAGEFTIQILDFPGNDVDLETLLKQTLGEFDKNGVSDEDIKIAVETYISEITRRLESVASKSATISLYHYMHNGKSYNLQEEIARYKKVSKEDVMRVFRKYVLGKNYVMIRVFPKRLNAAISNAGEESEAGAQTSGIASAELEYKGLTYKRAIDNFDRSVKPTPGTFKEIEVPEFFNEKFDNGIQVIGTRTSETPTVAILIKIKGGNNIVGDLNKLGLASFTATLMGESTQNMTGEEFDIAARKLGSTISFGASADETNVNVVCEKIHLDATLKLLEEVLMHPKFNQDDFRRLQRQYYRNIESNMQNPSYLAMLIYSKLMFGSKSLQGNPSEGTTKTIKGMSLKDVQGYYNRFYAPDFTKVIIVGDVSQDEIMPKLNFLKSWTRKNIALPILSPAIYKDQTQIYLIDKFKIKQSVIIVACPAIPYDWNGKFYKSNVMNFALGGNFNSRLNLNLREDKGFTYGIRGGFGGNEYYGTFGTSASVRASSTDSAVREIMYEINNYRNTGITDEEIVFTKSSLTQSQALQYESLFQKAGFLNNIIEHNLPRDFQAQQKQILKGMEKTEINKIAKEMLTADKMMIIVVADRDKVTEPLKKLGYKVTEIEIEE